MNFLALVQSLHYEAKLPGSPPDAVSGQSGRDADLVRWTAEAYNDIQRDMDSRWKWLRSDWTVDTEADTQSYAAAVVTDVEDAAFITRFLAWDVDEENLPFIYLASEGITTEREIYLDHWNDFRRQYVRAFPDATFPSRFAVDPADNLQFGPKPDDVYTVTGSYWKSIQSLVADADTPEMPANYPFLVVYRALVKYA